MYIYYHTGSMDPINEICTRQERFICSSLKKNGFDGQKEIDSFFWVISVAFFNAMIQFWVKRAVLLQYIYPPICWPCWDTKLDDIDNQMAATSTILYQKKYHRIGMFVSNTTPSFLNQGSPHEYLCFLIYNGTNWEGTY